jgi:hypothetical protein
MDSRYRAATFAVDMGAATKAVDALDVNYLPQAWGTLLDEALGLLRQSDKQRKELYLLSGLGAHAWQETQGTRLRERLAAASNVTVQVIDVGIDDVRNDALVDLQLPQQLLASGSPLEVRTRVSRDGPAGSCLVRLLLEAQDTDGPILVDGRLELPPATIRGKQTVDLDRNGSQTVSFSLTSLAEGTHHGYVEVEGDDGLRVDNRRYFSVHVRPPWPVLVAAPSGVTTRFLTEWLAPYEFRETGRAKFSCTVVGLDDLPEQRLDDFAAVALLDPTPLSDQVWLSLQRYVQRGGGLALFLGRRVGAASQFNTDAALTVLPGPVKRQWRDDQGLAFAPQSYDHPVLAPFRDQGSTTPWSALPVFRHWVLGPLSEGSREILLFRNNKAALAERWLGEGRIILMTTPISEAESGGRRSWNQLVSSLDAWPILMLVDRMFLYLVHSDDARLNYVAGQVAQLPFPETGTERLPMLTPRSDWREVTASGGEVRVTLTDTPGTYRLKLSATTRTPRGFSVNLPPAGNRLERLSAEQLDERLGSGRYRLARNEQEIVREIDQARIGREFYPLLICMLVVVLAMEHLLANRFYPAGQPAK